MTQLIPFDDALINPENVYRIDRVVETVTFTLLVGGTPAGSLATEDFVFGSEAEAITALANFVAATQKGQLTLAEACAAIAAGIMSNNEITDGALNNRFLGTPEERGALLIEQIISGGIELKTQYDAV